MNTLSASNGMLVWTYNGETLKIIPWGEDSFRILAGRDNVINNVQPWALLPAKQSNSEIIKEENTWFIINGKLKAAVDLQGRVIFFNEKEQILLQEKWRQRDNGDNFWGADGVDKRKKISALKISGREFKDISGQCCRITLRFEPSVDEKLFGMGQYQQPDLDLKGCVLELAQRNSQASVPFVISSKGYGFLWNNPAIGEATFAKNETRWVAEAAECLDYWITAGEHPAEILKNYAQATGKPPVMPEFALGLWQSKLRYRTQEELLSVAREYQRRGIPLAVIVADFFHWPVQGDWRFDPREWPDPAAMVTELKEMGTELMVSVWPTVDIRSENYPLMNEQGYLVNTRRGLNINFDFLGNSRFIDVTHPEARKFLWKVAKKNYFDKGVRLFWLDEAEPEYGVYDFDNYRYHIGNTQEVGNIYPLYYSQAFYDGMIEAGIQQPVNLVRCAWAGSQRYGALVWSGDIHSSFDSMRNQLSAGLNMAMAGIPWWTTDIGGFHGGNVDDPQFHELLIRWFQWGVFCPVLRMHGHRDPITEPEQEYRDGIAQCNTGAGNELWSFGETTFQILKRFAALRESLRPYIRKLMLQAHDTGEPLMRPMFYEFPDIEICWSLDDQYMFGPDILVAPVLQAGMEKRSVYLPLGYEWTDPFSGRIYEGGQIISLETPIETSPILVKSHSETLDYF